MQSPGDGVPPMLLPHVHLVSRQSYPVMQQASLDVVTDFLSKAPTVTKEVAPMFWTYLNAPPDGSIILTWQPPNRGEMFGTDGYIWADSEHNFHAECRGFTIQCLVQRSGYKPGVDRIAIHSRYRYRIVGKGPQNPNPYNPNLWIVHYKAADSDSRIPAQMVQVPPEMQPILRTRQVLESQGQLVRKEFMLHDQNNWPTVSVPGGSIPANPYVQQGAMYPGMGRGTPYGYNQPHPPNIIGQPPSKRPRVSGQPPRPGAPAPGIDTSIEDEENTTTGDQFDHLTPQEISQMRYMQHHEWMEEIFSSPFAPSQIVPVDLGLGLVGELSTLTAGLTEAPMEDFGSPPKGPGDSTPANLRQWKEDTVTNAKLRTLRKEDVDELEVRVQTHAEHAKREMEEMRKEHARHMSDLLRRSKTLANAEKRLRDAKGIEPEGFGDEPWRLDSQPWLAGSRETVSDVVRDVEAKLDTKIQSRKDVVCVDKGGYLEPQANGTQAQNGTQNDMSSLVNNNMSGNNGQDSSFGGFDGTGVDDTMDGSMDLHNTAAGLLDELGEGSFHSTPQMEMNQSAIDNQHQGSGEMPDEQHTQSHGQVELTDATGGTDSGMDLVESMDLDGQMIDIGAGDVGAGDDQASKADPNPGDDWVMVEQQDQPGRDDVAAAQLQLQPDSKPSVTSAAEQVSAEASSQQQQGVSPAEENHGVPQDLFDDTTGDGTGDNDFAALEDFNSTGDGLVDFDGGAGGDGTDLDLGLDDSAFGNAVFGTEDRTEGIEDQGDGLGDNTS
ncbi:MAG: hypothetical protein M1821_008679 [Bathelium mastoideum]|nr:MAG: hypothetical protein M1821_008679 [Bathelium mastoideum]